MKKFFSVLVLVWTMVFFGCNALYATSIGELRKMYGKENIEKIASSSYVTSNVEKFKNSIMTTLIDEMRPFLGDVVGEKTSVYDVPADEMLNNIIVHPIKFLSALYEYVVYSIIEVFDIAAENAVVDVEVKK